MLPTNPEKLRRETLRKEVEEIEAAMKKGQEPTQSVEVKEEGSPSKSTEIITEQKKPTQETVKDLEYWKAECGTWKSRYSTTKAKQDSNIYNLRQENLSLKEEVVNLSKALNQARQSMPKSASKLDEAFGSEEVDVLGEKTADTLKTIIRDTNKRVDDQEARIEAEKLKRKEDKLSEDRKSEYAGFKARLAGLVKNLDKLNADQKFIDWLQLPDELTGDLRHDILRKAEAGRDVGRCAELFNQYNAVAAKEEPTDSINKRIAPTQQAGSDTVQDIQPRDELTIAEVDKFYLDVRKGLYKGRYTEEKAMVEKIDHAQSYGLIKF